MRQVPDWKDYFLDIAKTVSTRSKDPKRQVGCIIVHPESKTIRSGGYNGMVFGVKETPEIWDKQNKEQFWLCHAEANAIALAARNGSSINGCDAYVTYFPCLPCARLLVQSGIKKIITPKHECGLRNMPEYEQVVELLHQVRVGFETEIVWV
jgi:dCMP deaminase